MPEMQPKNIVLCSDGTGNSPEKGRGTNVWRMFLAVDRHAHETDPGATRQIAFYDNGVGTSAVKLKQVIGSALGVGLGRNIRQLYTALAKNYEPGDRIFLFGFSRGAFTVRSLAGMIAHVGVVDGRSLGIDDLEELVEAAYWAYRSRVPRARRNFSRLCSDKANEPHAADVHFVGVWDTVGAVGVPFDWPRALVQKAALLRRPHNVDLTDKIDHAYHALAIDDERRSFKVEMFDESRGKKSKTVEQVWFAGVHSNVGGGYSKKGLENVALHWMMVRACACGLRLESRALDEAAAAANVHSQLYDSRRGLAAYYRYRPRDVADYCSRGNTEAKIHCTAMDRIERATDNYAPVNLPALFKVVGTDPENSHEVEGAKNYEESVAESASVRTAPLDRARRLTRAREVLYFLFLGVSLFLAAILALHELDRVSNGRTDWVARWSDAGIHAVDGLSEGLRPFLGWIRSTPQGVTSGLQSGVKLALPDLLTGPVLSLFDHPELAVLIGLVGWAMFWIRRRLVRRIRSLGVNMWRESFRGS